MSPKKCHVTPGIDKGRGERDRRDDKPSRDDQHHREDQHHKGRRDNGGRREKISFCYFHGKVKGHWTNEYPITIERKEEFDRQNAQLAMPVNYTSQPPPQKPSTSGPMWSPTPNWPVSYPVLNYTPVPYTQALPGPPPQPMPILPPSAIHPNVVKKLHATIL